MVFGTDALGFGEGEGAAFSVFFVTGFAAMVSRATATIRIRECIGEVIGWDCVACKPWSSIRAGREHHFIRLGVEGGQQLRDQARLDRPGFTRRNDITRSEERRVGKEWRSRWVPDE